MDSNKPLSKVQPDLLMERDMVRSVPIDNIDHSPVNNPVVLKKDLVVPKHKTMESNMHELLSSRSRMHKTVDGLVSERRSLGGNAYAEQFIRELRSASLINRGPPGMSNGSGLHWDVLTGRDDTIEPCDYLNFDFHEKY